jgi:hypothetical protein
MGVWVDGLMGKWVVGEQMSGKQKFASTHQLIYTFTTKKMQHFFNSSV